MTLRGLVSCHCGPGNVWFGLLWVSFSPTCFEQSNCGGHGTLVSDGHSLDASVVSFALLALSLDLLLASCWFRLRLASCGLASSMCSFYWFST